jgi:hypothetical protein
VPTNYNTVGVCRACHRGNVLIGKDLRLCKTCGSLRRKVLKHAGKVVMFLEEFQEKGILPQEIEKPGPPPKRSKKYLLHGRYKTTGRFDTREQLEARALYLWYEEKASKMAIARDCRVSLDVMKGILKREAMRRLDEED